MSKLATIRKELNSKNISVFEEKVDNFPGNLDSVVYAQQIHFHVSPDKFGFDMEYLQDFMLGLVSIKPTIVNDFRYPNPNDIVFGRMHFVENFGTIRRQSWQIQEITDTDPDFNMPEGFVDGIWASDTGVETFDVTRRTTICVYPDRSYINLAMQGVHVSGTCDRRLPKTLRGEIKKTA